MISRERVSQLRKRSYDAFREAEQYLRRERAKGTPYEEYWPNYRYLYSEAMRLSSIVRVHTER